jgi:hypothetical protein
MSRILEIQLFRIDQPLSPLVAEKQAARLNFLVLYALLCAAWDSVKVLGPDKCPQGRHNMITTHHT